MSPTVPPLLWRWRLCLVHLLVIGISWELVGRIWFRVDRGWLPCIAALVAWGVGLTLTGNYRATAPSLAAGWLRLVDHLVISAVWLGFLVLCNAQPGLAAAGCFVGVTFAGLLGTSIFSSFELPNFIPAKLDRGMSAAWNRVARGQEAAKKYSVPVIPRTLLLGIGLGLALMSLLGRWAAREPYHKNFARITPWMAPSTNYYPTALELANIVRQKTRPGTILVLVGGNSVFYGIGQPPDHVWTADLQQALGSGYSVVNLALPGAAVTDGAAVIAEALRDEFPRQIYLANVWACQTPLPGGSLGAYRYIFWDADDKGLLMKAPARLAAMHETIARYDPGEGIGELRRRMFLDRFLYFQDGWNYVTYTKFGTMWGHYPLGAIWGEARDRRGDTEADFLTTPVARRFAGQFEDADLSIIRNRSEPFFESDDTAGTPWKAKAEAWEKFRQNIDPLFPVPLKKRTLMVINRDCPYFMTKLSPGERERDELSYPRTVQAWQENGYEALDTGRDFSIEDYGDRVHLTSLGGAKLAKLVAGKVIMMSRKLGYLAP